MQRLPLDIAVCKTFGEYGDGRPRCGAPRKLGRYTFSDGLNKTWSPVWVGHSRRFDCVTLTSGPPPIPDVALHRNN
jgi:hypothetical protein